MDAGLTLTPLRYTLRAREPLMLDAQPGSALRGTIFHALLRRFCTMQAEMQCATCPVVVACPVAGLAAPLRDEQPARGRDVPRPFVLRPPLLAAQHDGLRLQAGDTVAFGFTLIGIATAYFPYLALSASVMESLSLGRPLAENQGRRGRFIVAAIDVVDKDGAPQHIYTHGERNARIPNVTITATDIGVRANTLSDDHVSMQFLTPTRLIDDGKLAHTPEPKVLLRRLAERLDALEREYLAYHDAQPGPNARGRWYQVAATADLTLAKWEGTWIDLKSYSSRTQRTSPISGFVGRATFTGTLTPAVRELLAWGEYIHVGKNAVKGDGWYQLLME